MFFGFNICLAHSQLHSQFLYIFPPSGAGGQGMGVVVRDITRCLCRSFFLTLFPSSSVGSHPQETVLHEVLQRGSFPWAAVLHELLQHGSFPWSAVLQEWTAPAWVLQGPQVLPGACSSVGSPWGHSLLQSTSTCSDVGSSMGCRGWRLNHFPGQPVPMLDNPFREEKFPNIQSKPPLVQLEAISSCPVTCYLGEETNTHLSTTSFQAKQSQLPQPLLIRLLLQTLHQLRCPSLDSLQHLNVSLVVRGPKLNTVFEVRPHQCRVQGHNHFPSPAGHTIFDTSQDAIGFLGHLGTLLAHIQAAVNQHPQVLLCQAAFQTLFPRPVALHGVAVSQVQDRALGLVKPHTIDLGPLIQPVQVPLQSLPTLKQINTPTQLGDVCKLTEGALDPFVQIIDKDIKQNWPQHRALGNTACDRPPTGVNSIHHHSLGPAIQPVLYPAKSTPVQAMSSQFLQENAVGNRVKGFTEV
ncbi:hypothetical protein QYF61_013358 [Mycteria americana]|uniref:Uncharacterized protein n=1 Tax=Mycteria americana TaxID=33587 RepID=A0AAN7RPL9_MYCAM|nr:hypothetical protein QYF61_013358 [Mycteria americana]